MQQLKNTADETIAQYLQENHQEESTADRLRRITADLTGPGGLLSIRNRDIAWLLIIADNLYLENQTLLGLVKRDRNRGDSQALCIKGLAVMLFLSLIAVFVLAGRRFLG